jgi:hypothetical protein
VDNVSSRPNDSVMPDSVMPHSVMPDSVMPDSVMPDSVMPDSVMPSSVMPGSRASAPTAPSWTMPSQTPMPHDHAMTPACTQSASGADADHTVGLEAVRELKALYRADGLGTVTPVHGSRRESKAAESALQPPHALRSSLLSVTGAGIEHRGLIDECRQRYRTSDAVDGQPVGGLESEDSLLGQRAVAPVDRTGSIPGASETQLQGTDDCRTACAAIAGAGRQQQIPA